MANDLKIKIIGTLDKTKTKDEVNLVIGQLQGKVDKLNIDIKIDQKILKVLTDFANEIKKIGKNIFQFPNLPNGFTGQQKQLKDLINGYKELNKEIKYYADGSIKTITRTYADNKGNGRKITTNANDEVINYKDIENIAKFEKEQQKLRQTLSDLAKTGKYTTDELITDRVRKAKYQHYIYEHDYDKYDIGEHNCLFSDVAKLLANGFKTRNGDVRPANSVSTAFQLIAVIFQCQSQVQFGGVASAHIDYDIAPYVKKSFAKHLKDGIKWVENITNVDVPKEISVTDKAWETILQKST
jgi:anaerobic ribonucleoside-triphosphate reductase